MVILKKSNILYFTFVLLLQGCQSSISSNDLFLNDGIYCIKKNSVITPFSGKVEYFFEDRTLSGVKYLKNGIPLKSESYDFNGAIVSYSSYSQLLLKPNDSLIKRASVLKLREGNYEEERLLIILDSIIVDSAYMENVCNSIFMSYNKTNITNTSLVLGEFEFPFYKKLP